MRWGRIAPAAIGGPTSAGAWRNGMWRLASRGFTGCGAITPGGSSRAVMTPSYVELHARSAYSFLRGASNPEELAEIAAQLKLPALALCDRDGVYGAPRFYKAMNEAGLRPIVGAELTLEDGSVLPVLVQN